MDDEHVYDIIRWQAPEFEYKEKSADWYWILGIVAVVGAVIAVILNNILFALFIAIAAFVTAVFASKHPDELFIECNKRGIQIEDRFYPYRSIDSFWVEDNAEGKEKLLFTPEGMLALQVAVAIEGIDPDLVRDFLLQYIDEVEQRETVAERIAEYLHF